jgi:O-antigen/teichoic acid export membrane protein
MVFAGVGALNIGNAAFHLLTARLLGPAQYAEVVSLVAASGLIALPFGGIQLAVARFVADDASRGRGGAVASFVRRSLVGTTVLASALTAVVVLASPLIQRALSVHTLTPVILMALYTFPALLAPALWGVAQGLQRFGLFSGSIVAGVAVRIAIVIALIPLGVGVGGVMGATFLGAFAALVVPFPLVWRWLKHPTLNQAPPSDRVVLAYAVPVMAGTLAITSLTTADLIVAKVVLPANQAGIYGGASFIGRLLLYLPMTVATVLLPKVTSRVAANRDTREILHASLAVTAVLSLAGTGLLVALPHLVIAVTFGSKFEGAVPLIGLFGLAMTAYALLNVMLVYHLGHGRRGMAWFLLLGAMAQLGLFGLIHGSTYQLVGANLGAAVALLIAHEIFFESTLPGAGAWLLRRIKRIG